MTDHEWEDLGPVYPGASPVLGRRWTCGRCGMRVRSNGRPAAADARSAPSKVVYVLGPSGPFQAGSVDRYPSDCDDHVVRSVMRR